MHESSESDVLMTPAHETPLTGQTTESSDFLSGPRIGERLPEINLQDQKGDWVNLEQARGSRRALVLFHRSVRW